MTTLKQAAQQALDALEISAVTVDSFRVQKATQEAITALKAALEQPEQRSDGMPQSKTERHLRRMLCAQRHGAGVYMDDGEASFGGDQNCRSIDYMRESVDAIEQAWRDAGIKKLTAAQPEQEPVACLSKTQAKAILDLALDLEKTGRLVSLTEGQERSNFVTRNRAIQCALEDALRNATTPPAAQRPWVGQRLKLEGT